MAFITHDSSVAAPESQHLAEHDRLGLIRGEVTYDAGVGPIEVHQGFYQGARRQLPDIQSVVAAHAQNGGKRLPVCHPQG